VSGKINAHAGAGSGAFLRMRRLKRFDKFLGISNSVVFNEWFLQAIIVHSTVVQVVASWSNLTFQKSSLMRYTFMMVEVAGYLIT
jgi:hypothetical protein